MRAIYENYQALCTKLTENREEYPANVWRNMADDVRSEVGECLFQGTITLNQVLALETQFRDIFEPLLAREN